MSSYGVYLASWGSAHKLSYYIEQYGLHCNEWQDENVQCYNLLALKNFNHTKQCGSNKMQMKTKQEISKINSVPHKFMFFVLIQIEYLLEPPSICCILYEVIPVLRPNC